VTAVWMRAAPTLATADGTAGTAVATAVKSMRRPTGEGSRPTRGATLAPVVLAVAVAAMAGEEALPATQALRQMAADMTGAAPIRAVTSPAADARARPRQSQRLLHSSPSPSSPCSPPAGHDDAASARHELASPSLKDLPGAIPATVPRPLDSGDGREATG
jgi:hypothetical protein